MAVYKPTYCYPFLNALDARVVSITDDVTPCQYLKCKIESSNKQITGYSIRILDENNNVIFPLSFVDVSKAISPIIELEQDLGDQINSGLNGTYLYIPFFQNFNNKKTNSNNAIYYIPKFKVHYLLEDPTGWTYNSTAQQLENSQFSGIIDEEAVLVGDLILISSSDAILGGIWEMQSNATMKRFHALDTQQEVTNNYFLTHASYITVTQGSLYHDCIYYANGTTYELQDSNAKMWVDYNNHEINIFNKGNSYKWEVTLYQSASLGFWADGIFYPNTRAEVTNLLCTMNGTHISAGVTSSIFWSYAPWYVDYSTLDNAWYDMVLNRGNILGSNVTRIQIARHFMTPQYNGWLLPGENNNEPLVLQGTYIQLLDVDYNPIGARAYVETFDSTFGHIYPIEGSFTQEQIDASNNVAFYKYSNDSGAILANDSVKVASFQNVVKDLNSTNSIDGVSLNVGDRVLLEGQTDPSTNGIYRIESAGTTWVRDGGYKTWGKFIGQVFYVKEGTNYGEHNFLCQAQAGGTIDSSPLYFTDEPPIILFSSVVERTIDLKADADPASYNMDTEIDGYHMQVGTTILYQNTVYTVESLGDPSNTYLTETLDSDTIVRISKGKLYGYKCYSINSPSFPPIEYYGVSTATILKNDVNSTFIKPYSELSPKMMLQFLNGQTITYADNSVKNYLKISDEYEADIVVNKKIWLVLHDELKEPLPSTGVGDGSFGYTYDIKSFFKASDENVFSLYDIPYIKLSNGEQGYSNIAAYVPFIVGSTTPSDGDYYIVRDELEVYLDGEIFHVKAPSLASIGTRLVSLQGFYYQWQQASWESYRWLLTDYLGNVIQDTGKKYGQDMSVTFYGLSNDSLQYNNVYYAVLIVEDQLGNALSYGACIIVDPASTRNLDIPFYATFDCETQSVILSYQNVAYIKPTYISSSSSYAQAYIETNEALYGIWDDSLQYGDSWGKITGPQGDETVTVPDLISGLNMLSCTEKNGVEYSYTYEKEGFTQRIDTPDHHVFVINPDSTGGEFAIKTRIQLSNSYCGDFFDFKVDYVDGGNKLGFKLGIPMSFTSVSDNILNVDRNTIDYIFYRVDANGDIVSTIKANKLLTDSNANYTWRTLPAEDSKRIFYLQSYSVDSASFWGESQDSHVLPLADREYLHYASFTIDGHNYYPYYILAAVSDDDSIVSPINTNKFLGNTCLVSDADISGGGYSLTASNGVLSSDAGVNFPVRGAPCYWVEDRPHMTLICDDAQLLYPMNLSNQRDPVITSAYTESWPTAANENNYYWNEIEMTMSTSLPSFWDEIASHSSESIHNYWSKDASQALLTKQGLLNMGWKVLDAFPTNEGHLGTKYFDLIIRIFDIDAIYLASDVTLIATGSVGVGGNTHITTLTIGETVVGTISLEEVTVTE